MRSKSNLKLDSSVHLPFVLLPVSNHTNFRDPPAQAAMVYGFETSFDLKATFGDTWTATTHEWVVTCSLDTLAAHTWSPSTELNLVDGHGIHVMPIRSASSSSSKDISKRETFVVLKPL